MNREFYCTTDDGVLIEGYDVVAYFTENAAVKGDSRHSVTQDGITLHFSSEDNKSLFEQSPEKYMPKYGGWCGFALGEKDAFFGVNPETFKVRDGSLYLFYNGDQGNASVWWNDNEPQLMVKAEERWKEKTSA